MTSSISFYSVSTDLDLIQCSQFLLTQYVYIYSLPVFPVLLWSCPIAHSLPFLSLHLFTIFFYYCLYSLFLFSPFVFNFLYPLAYWFCFHLGGFWFLCWNQILCSTSLITRGGIGHVHCCCWRRVRKKILIITCATCCICARLKVTKWDFNPAWIYESVI